MHILVLQHETVEHPGIFRDFLAEDGHSYDAVELQLGETLPHLDGYEALWVMGGPMDVWQEDEFPWLAQEKAFIRHAVVERKMPFLGLCLGHQLLAEALGGEVGPSQEPEVGIMPVEILDSDEAKAVFKGLPLSLETLQWHGAEVTRMPRHAHNIATSPACHYQAMLFGTHAVSAQFHMEIEEDTVANWAKIPAYAAALEKALGPGAVAQLEVAVAQELKAFNSAARIFYENWISLTISKTKPELMTGRT